MFESLAHAVVRRRWWIITAWLLAAVAITPFAPRLGEVTNSDESSFLPDAYESAQAAALAASAFPEEAGATALLVFKRSDGASLTTIDQRLVATTIRAVSASEIDHVARVETGAPDQLSPDRRIQLASVRFDGSSADAAVLDAAAAIREATAQRVAGSSLYVGLTGDAAIKLDDREAHSTAEKTVGAATVALILALLLVLFRSPVAALLPIASITIVFLVASSLIAVAARTAGFDVSPDLPALLTVVLFGIGTDYVLFMLFRYREHLRDGMRGSEAVVHAVARVGEVITFAALVVIVAFSALALSQLGSLRTMAPGLVTGVTLMWLAGITLIPAVLSLLGPRVFWPSRRWQHESGRSTYRRIGGLVARRPGRVAAVSSAFLVVLAGGTVLYSADYDSINQLPTGAASRQAYEDMRTSFPAGAITPTRVFVTGSKQLDRSKLAALAVEAKRPQGVAAVKPPRFSTDGRTAYIDVVLTGNPYAKESLDAIEGPIRDMAHSSGAGEHIVVGGQTAASVDIRAATNRDYAVVFPVAAALIALLLAWLLRSLVAPLYLLAAVMLGFAATLGVTVVAFQGVSGEPGVKSLLPVILYLFVVAVGTDYSILITARLREETLGGLSPAEATALGIGRAGPAIAAAGVILAGTFTSLLLTGIASLMQIGFAVSAGILITSLVMATLLVPAMTTLLGHRAWWPGRSEVRR